MVGSVWRLQLGYCQPRALIRNPFSFMGVGLFVWVVMQAPVAGRVGWEPPALALQPPRSA